MRHSRSSLLAFALLLAIPGCAFEDGAPWGVAELDFEVSQTGDAESVEFATVELELTSEAAQVADEHTHDHGHDHGETAAAAEGTYVATAFAHEAVAPTNSGVEVHLEDCTDGCRLPRGELTEVRVVVEAVTVTGEEVEVDAVVSAALDELIDRDEPGGLRIALRYVVPELAGDAEQMREALEASPLVVEVERVDVADVARGEKHADE